MIKQAYEAGVRRAFEDAGLLKEAAFSPLRMISGGLDMARMDDADKDRKMKALAVLLGAGTAGIGTGIATDSAGYGALAAPLGGAAGYGLASLLSDRGAKWF